MLTDLAEKGKLLLLLLEVADFLEAIPGHAVLL